jgi:hypothetical protein
VAANFLENELENKSWNQDLLSFWDITAQALDYRENYHLNGWMKDVKECQQRRKNYRTQRT